MADRIGPYEIIGRIAAGGMGTVYRAQHVDMKREVALKVLGTDLADDEEFVARFKREAQTISRLDHPNIIKVFDMGRDGATHYIAMEYISGGSLGTKLKQLAAANKRVPELDALRLIRPMADALGYAHKKGLVHRDIKPSNILLRPDGSPVLADFGIVQTGGATKLTRAMATIGTPEYMSPEQAQGLPLDGRSDLYSLGIVLYEMLSGTVPFKAETPLVVIYKLTRDALPDLAQARRDVSFATRRIVEKAAAKLPGDRFGNAAQMVAAMDGVIGDKPLTTLGRIGSTMDLLRPASGGKTARTAGAVLGFAGRAFLWMAALAVALAAILVFLLTFIGASLIENTVGSNNYYLHNTAVGERIWPLATVREGLRTQAPASTLNLIQVENLKGLQPDMLSVNALVNGTPVTLTLQVSVVAGAPTVTLQDVNGYPLPLLGPAWSTALSHGLSTAWQRERVTLTRIAITPRGLETTVTEP